MATPVQIIEEWGENSLVRIPAALLETVDLSVKTKDFLRQVGVPKKFKIYGGTEYEALPLLLTGAETLHDTNRGLLHRLPGMNLLPLSYASRHDDFFCIQEGDGAIGITNTWNDERIPTFTFVNSNVQAWVECLFICKVFVESIDEGPTKRELRSFVQHLKQIDAHVFENREGHWSVVVDEMGWYG